MDTKPLERFATRARRELLAAVEAQASAVLAAGSVARSERGQTVKRLEREIAEHGRKHVIDKVAYTWFNRLIALRYMDACGYTTAGIVSPAHGHDHGQPEILADAKRGYFDADVITSDRMADSVLGLLDGTRRSTDAEGEAYALLLTEYCRYWNKAMPFMFEREGDYTELLVPSGLLADGGILSRAREVLTEDVCKDVEVIGWLYQFYISERKDEVFAGFKKNKKAGADEIPAATQLFTPHWIVRYLVENSLGRLWMLNRPTSRLVDRMDYYIAPVDEITDFLEINGPEELTVIDPACGSGHMLTYAFDLLYAIYEEEGHAPSEIPSLILAHNLHGTEIDPRAGSLAAFALTMKARDKDRRFFTRSQVKPKICVIEPISFGPDELDFLVTADGDRHAEEAFWNQFRNADRLGALIQPDADEAKRAAGVLEDLKEQRGTLLFETLDEARKVVAQAAILSREYAIAVANPPYMGGKNMDPSLTAFAKERYPDAKSDLMTMFMKRSNVLTKYGGWWGMINLPSWMSLSSFAELREWLLKGTSIDTMLHFGRGVFGSDFGSVGFVVENRQPSQGRHGIYRKLFEEHVEVRSNEKIETLFRIPSYQRFNVAQDALVGIPGSPIAYWLSDAMRAAFANGRPLKETAEPRQGLSTGDNDMFVRSWWEVSASRSALAVGSREEAVESGARWFPYNKGGEFRKWWGNQEYLVNWENDGKAIRSFGLETGGRVRSAVRNVDYYFRKSVSWSNVSSGAPAFRQYPSGFIASASTGDGVYPGDSQELDRIVGVLNSSSVQAMLAATAPTLTFNVGTISLVPMPIFNLPQQNVAAAVADLVATARRDWDDFETSWGFAAPSWLDRSSGCAVRLRESVVAWSSQWAEVSGEQKFRETKNNRVVATAYGLRDEVPIEVPLHQISLTRNVEFRYGPGKSVAEYEALERADVAAELISYAVGCMFGRYSLDEPGLILADQGSTLQDYLAKVPSPTFNPDADNVIPFVDDGWFEDDIVERFRNFLRTSFGAKHFEENLRLVEESLGVRTIREYFIVKSNPSGKNVARSRFYEDHVQRYKKRPIYWMFSSPKGSFNALVYMHRYTPSTVSTVLNEYLREYRAKLEVALQRAEEASAGGASAKAQKEADRLRAILAELRDYEHDVLYPLDIQRVEIDLDNGVRVNYPKFYPALRKITGLEASDG
ncbi:BREX-1 system adenine-specific DNA-methyltransferase PglX [Nocardia gipuzkoensis]|uniref:BREX-1 system adenine-specific DNA-methyltransferase PglX n=1 Tax=Nocardia gipuzkoensis TaxID=2749991 RepID=UPI001E547E10|nr:BREX-1 system adenine-specific DNA-methyltransferase PglX [Nocardia gipuzkoensis]UGT67963.1 BREX-1 system adenine-specific DNA-methyltransferase PglX [Nocardia gipuzkoensis]